MKHHSYPPLSNRFEIICQIGQGGYGIVYKAREISTKEIVAIKQIKKISQNKNGFPIPALREIILLKDLKGSQNVLDLRDILTCDSELNVYIVYDYSEYDLNTIIYYGPRLNFQQAKSYLKQMITGLLVLHSNNFFHRDIKPSNFLISTNNIIKLIDFGLARKIHYIYSKKNRKYTDLIGTYSYRAPEIILGATDYGPEIDIWSLGCTLYEMIACKNLFQKCNTEIDIAKSIIEIFGFPSEDEWPEFYTLPNINLFFKSKAHKKMTTDEFFEKNIPDEFKPMKKLLLNMLQLNPKNRISLIDALNDPILSDTESPKNFPHISLEESFQKGNRKSSLKKKTVRNNYADLRPPKILPISTL